MDASKSEEWIGTTSFPPLRTILFGSFQVGERSTHQQKAFKTRRSGLETGPVDRRKTRMKNLKKHPTTGKSALGETRCCLHQMNEKGAAADSIWLKACQDTKRGRTNEPKPVHRGHAGEVRHSFLLRPLIASTVDPEESSDKFRLPERQFEDFVRWWKPRVKG